jgi:membrane protein
METAVNAMFKIKKKRNFLVSLFLGLLVITAIAVFLLVSFVFTLHEPLLSFFGGVLKWPKIAGIYEVLLKYVVPFVLVLSASVVVYIILPVARVRLSCAFWGGLFTSSMLEIAKHAFTFYVKKAVPVIGAVYGPLTAFFVFLMWIFYSCCIFLIGGEIVHNLGESKVARAGGVKRRA